MSTIFLNLENSKTSDAHKLRLNLTNISDLPKGDNHVALSNLSVYYIWKNIKILYKNNEFERSRTTWDEKFKLADRSYSIPDIQNYFEYMIKKHQKLTEKSPIQIYVNRIQN